jgi:hypothetical protein
MLVVMMRVGAVPEFRLHGGMIDTVMARKS